MSNVTVQEALTAAIELIQCFEAKLTNSQTAHSLPSEKVKRKLRDAISEIEKCEKNKAVLYGVFILDGNGQWQIVHNYMVHVYIYEEPAHFYKEKIEYEAKEAGESIEVAIFKFYTSPQPREWVGLSDDDIRDVFRKFGWTANRVDFEDARAIESKLKQLNTKG